MGIPKFNSWFHAAHAPCYVRLDDAADGPGAQGADHVYVDMNSVLHSALRQARNTDAFYATLFKRLDAILRTSRPRRTLMLAVDGPAPLAKLLTQRLRRKRTVLIEARKAARASSSSKKGGGGRHGGHGRHGKTDTNEKAASSVALTPGTPFMHDVAVALSFWVASRLAQPRWRGVRFEVSGATVPGEGEVKILGRLARPWPHVRPGDSHVIVGDDADLVLMALVSRAPRLFVLNAAFNDGVVDSGMEVLSVGRLQQWWGGGPQGAQALLAAAAASKGQQKGGGHHHRRSSGRGGVHGASAAKVKPKPDAPLWRAAAAAGLAAQLQAELAMAGGGGGGSGGGGKAPAPPQHHALAVAGAGRLLLGFKADLALLAIVASGNDYLPGVRMLTLTGAEGGTGDAGLWRCYRDMRLEPRWAGRAVVVLEEHDLSAAAEGGGNGGGGAARYRGDGGGLVSAALDAEFLAELLVRARGGGGGGWGEARYAAAARAPEAVAAARAALASEAAASAAGGSAAARRGTKRRAGGNGNGNGGEQEEEEEGEGAAAAGAAAGVAAAAAATILKTNDDNPDATATDADAKGDDDADAGSASGGGSSSSGASSSSDGEDDEEDAALFDDDDDDSALPRGRTDPDLYLHGALWTMTTYLDGACPDYRFSYDGGSPSIEAVVGVLRQRHAVAAAAMTLRGDNGGAPSPIPLVRLSDFPPQPKGRSVDPLPPHVCSLALLPAGASSYLPEALRPLVSSGSAVWDIFEDCDECASIMGEVSKCSARLGDLNGRLRALANGEGGGGDAQEIRREIDATRQALRKAEARRKSHGQSKHPYAPFPVQRLVDASAEVLLKSGQDAGAAGAANGSGGGKKKGGSGGGEQDALFEEGRSYLFEHGGQQQQASLFRPPPPPVGRFGAVTLQQAACVRLALDEAAGGEAVPGRDPQPARFASYLELRPPPVAQSEAAHREFVRQMQGGGGGGGGGQMQQQQRGGSRAPLPVRAPPLPRPMPGGMPRMMPPPPPPAPPLNAYYPYPQPQPQQVQQQPYGAYYGAGGGGQQQQQQQQPYAQQQPQQQQYYQPPQQSVYSLYGYDQPQGQQGQGQQQPGGGGYPGGGSGYGGGYAPSQQQPQHQAAGARLLSQLQAGSRGGGAAAGSGGAGGGGAGGGGGAPPPRKRFEPVYAPGASGSRASGSPMDLDPHHQHHHHHHPPPPPAAALPMPRFSSAATGRGRAPPPPPYRGPM